MNKKYLTLIAVILTSGIASAGLVMNIDTDAKKLHFTESTTGSESSGLPWWEFGDLTGGVEGLGLDSALDMGFCTMWVYDSGGAEFYVDVVPPTTITLTGSGTKYSYEELSTTAQNSLENMIGNSMSLTSGTGFESISVIPEPSTMSLITLSGVGAVLIRRRCKR